MSKGNGNGNGNGEIKSSDLYFAAYLQTAGVPMKRTERAVDSGKVYFIFDTTIVNIEELKTAWFNNSGKVAANPYAFAIKSLKALCHLK